MTHRYAFDRLELAGSLGDLGTLLPLAIGMILINKIDAAGLFFSVGLYYILAGIYFGVTVPVQPMKVVGAYAIAMGLSASQIMASSLWLAGIFIVIGATGAMDLIGKYTPKPVVRGVQLSTGVLLMAEGVKFMIGTSKFQLMAKAAEPFLTVQRLGPLPVGILIGGLGGLLTLLLLENRKLPAGLVVVCGGVLIGLIMGTHAGAIAAGPASPTVSVLPLPESGRLRQRPAGPGPTADSHDYGQCRDRLCRPFERIFR
jgi:SulP family sulfate permease